MREILINIHPAGLKKNFSTFFYRCCLRQSITIVFKTQIEELRNDGTKFSLYTWLFCLSLVEFMYFVCSKRFNWTILYILFYFSGKFFLRNAQWSTFAICSIPWYQRTLESHKRHRKFVYLCAFSQKKFYSCQCQKKKISQNLLMLPG